MRRFAILLIFLLAVLPGFSRAYVVDSTWRDGVTLETNDYIALPSTVTLASTTWTLEAWAKISTVPVVATQTIFSTQTGRMDCLVDSTNSLAFYDGTTYYRAASYPAGISWRHLVYSPSESQISVDGVSYSTPTVTGKNIGGSSTIGAAYTPGVYFNGAVKNIRVWSRILTAAEKSGASLRLTGNEPGLLYYLPGDDGINGDPVLPQTVFGPSSFDSAVPNVWKQTPTTGTLLATITTPITSYPFTISYWSYAPTATGNNKSSSVGFAIPASTTSRFSVSASHFGGYSIFVVADSTGVYDQSFGASGGAYDRWNYLSCVFATSSRKLYVNGTLMRTDANAVPAPNASYTQIHIASSWGSYGGSELPNSVRNAAFWQKGLSASEIAAEMIRSTPATTTGLVCYFPLNETTGSTAVDIGPNGYHGTITGGTRVSLTPKTADPVSYKAYPAFAGRYGAAKSLRTDAVNDTIFAPLSISATYPVTFGGWMQLDPVDADGSIASVGIASASSEDFAAISLVRSGATVLCNSFISNGAGNTATSVDCRKPYSTAIHAMFVCESATSRKVYVMGVLATESTALFAFPENRKVFCIGSMNRLTNPLYRKGYYHGIGCWSRALTAQEVAQQYYMDSPVSYQNLLGYWKMDEGTGNCADSSGNGNTAVVTGATWSVLPNNNGSITNTSTSWQRTLSNAFPPSFRSFLVTP